MDSTESGFSTVATTAPKFDTHSFMSPREFVEYCERTGEECPAQYLAEAGVPRTARERTRGEYAAEAGFPAVTVDALSHLTRPMHPRVMEWAAAYRGTGTPWLWVKGPTGRGKTVSAACAVAEVMRRMDAGEVSNAPAAFVRADHLTGEYMAANLYGKDSKYDLVRRVSEAGVLVLDDLGSEARGAVPFEAVGLVLGQRLDDMTPVIVTTQYGAREFIERMAERGADAHDVYATLGRVCDALAGWPHGLTDEQGDAAVLRNVVELDGECMRTGPDGTQPTAGPDSPDHR